MNEAAAYIASGILDLYALGLTSAEENAAVEAMAALHPEVREELEQVSHALGAYAKAHAVEPDPTIKPFLMASIDYMERLAAGEQPGFPPQLHEGSSAGDYREWLEREDLQLQEPLSVISARIIGYTPEALTAIVWLERGTPPEVHTDEYERFLILEGTCNIIVDGADNHLKPGDVFFIPLHLSHTVVVTSGIPCKVILQRVAA